MRPNGIENDANIVQVIGLVFVVAATVTAILRADEEDQPIVALVSFVAIALAVLLWFWLRNRSKPDSVEATYDLDPWLHAVREQMRSLWVDQALANTEELRQDLSVRGDASWLHPEFQDAMSLKDGEVIDLTEIDGVGGLFKKLEGSYLLIGKAGSGKSVSLWQTLEFLLDHGQDVLLVEAYRWQEFDNGTDDRKIPRFEDFVAWALRDPSFGTPPEVAKRLVPKLTLLLDGLDELAEIDRKLAARFLTSLTRATDRNKLRKNRVVTSRPGEYEALQQVQGSGINSVKNAVVIKPYPEKTVITAVKGRYPKLPNLEYELDNSQTLRNLSLRPLWLSLLIDLHEKDTASRPMQGIEDLSEEVVERAIYSKWLEQVASGRPSEWKTHTGFIASRMQQTGAQTLRLEDIQPSWLPYTSRNATLLINVICGLICVLSVGLIGGLSGGLIFGLSVGLSVGLSSGLSVGLIFGLIFGLSSGFVSPTAKQQFSVDHISRSDLTFGLSVGLIGGLIFGLIGGLIFGLSVGLIVGLSSGLSNGFVSRPQDRPYQSPYQAILIDLKLRAMPFILVSGLIGGLSSGLIGGLSSGLIFGLSSGLIFGLSVGLSVGLIGGLRESVLLPHTKARMLTRLARSLPRRLVPFLEDLTHNKLMYKVGAGYRFRHRTLTKQIAEDWGQHSSTR